MSSANLERRMDRIEARIETTGCPACRDRPVMQIVLGDEPFDQPGSCSKCGRDFAESMIWIGVREDGPQ